MNQHHHDYPGPGDLWGSPPDDCELTDAELAELERLREDRQIERYLEDLNR